MALNWLINNPNTQYNVIGFLDDDPYKLGRQIQGVNVIGNLSEFYVTVEKYDFAGIVFPSENALESFQNSSAVEICQERGIWLKRLQINFEDVDILGIT